MNERLLALDIGDVRIGVAVSDPTRLIATPVEVIRRVGWGPDVKRIRQLCEQYETTEVLSGLPLNMDGTAGFQSEKVRKFCEQLERAGLTVYYQDERLSTVTAEDALLEGNVSREGRRQVVDKVAAAVILQSYLDEQREARDRQNKEEAPMMDEKNMPEDMENEEENEDDGIVELIGDDGETVRFEHLATLEHEGSYYILLTEDTEDENEDAEVVILRIEQDSDGSEIYVAVEDDDIETAVFDKYVRMIEEAENGDAE